MVCIGKSIALPICSTSPQSLSAMCARCADTPPTTRRLPLPPSQSSFRGAHPFAPPRNKKWMPNRRTEPRMDVLFARAHAPVVNLLLVSDGVRRLSAGLAFHLGGRGPPPPPSKQKPRRPPAGTGTPKASHFSRRGHKPLHLTAMGRVVKTGPNLWPVATPPPFAGLEPPCHTSQRFSIRWQRLRQVIPV